MVEADEQKKYDKDMSTEEVREYIEEHIKWGIEDGREMGIEDGRKEGLKQGRKEGIQQGMVQGGKESAIEIARALLNNGVPPKTISESTGLSLEELESLR